MISLITGSLALDIVLWSAIVIIGAPIAMFVIGAIMGISGVLFMNILETLDKLKR